QTVAGNHPRGRPGDGRGANVDDDRKPLDQLQDQGGPPDHQRHRDQQAGDHQAQVAFRGAGNGQYIVQPHQGIGQDDRAQGLPEGMGSADLRVVIGTMAQQIPGNRQQQQTAYQQQSR